MKPLEMPKLNELGALSSGNPRVDLVEYVLDLRLNVQVSAVMPSSRRHACCRVDYPSFVPPTVYDRDGAFSSLKASSEDASRAPVRT